MVEREQLEQAIAALEAQRDVLGDAVVEAGLTPMQERLAALVETEPPTSGLQGERRLATIILADVKGSTNLVERIGTEAWVEIMNSVFQILGSEIYRFGGEVDQFRGDGLVAFLARRRLTRTTQNGQFCLPWRCRKRSIVTPPNWPNGKVSNCSCGLG